MLYSYSTLPPPAASPKSRDRDDDTMPTTPYTQHLYPSPPYARIARQAHSFHAKDSPSTPRSPSNVELAQSLLTRAKSLGRSNQISHHLFPLISKFEALDALSQESQEVSLRPPPLQMSRKSTMRRGGFDGPASVKLEAIFSPTRRIQRSGETVRLENVVASPTEDVHTSGTFKRSRSGKLKQVQLPTKVNNVRLSSVIPRNGFSTAKESEFESRIPSYTGSKTDRLQETRDNSTVKERIKLFDGCVERTASSIPRRAVQNTIFGLETPTSATTPSSSNARLSHVRKFTPTTPRFQKPSCRNSAEPHSALSIGGSGPNTVAKQHSTPQTPTKPNPSAPIKRRRPIEQNAPNPFSQIPHTHPVSRAISPATISTSQTANKCRSGNSPVCGPSKVQDPLKNEISPQEKGCQRRMQEPPASRVSSVSKAKKTDKNLEAAHLTRTLEAPIDAEPERKESNYNDMKMLHEKSVVAKSQKSGPWSFPKEPATKIPKLRCQEFSRPAPPLSPTRAIPSTYQKSVSRSKPQQMDGTRIPSLVGRETGRPDPSGKAASGGIHDRIKRWENKSKFRGRDEGFATVNSSSEPVDKSTPLRKSIYENPWNEDIGRQLEKRGLDGDEIQAVMDEFQDMGGVNHSDDASNGPWKMVVAPRLGRNELAAQHDGETNEPGDMDMRIIVREAQCGLAEPKPLRLLEMKRMILLCRERVPVGAPGCKDRGNGTYPMKV